VSLHSEAALAVGHEPSPSVADGQSDGASSFDPPMRPLNPPNPAEKVDLPHPDAFVGAAAKGAAQNENDNEFDDESAATPRRDGLWILGVALTTLGVIVLGFLATFLVIGPIKYHREQTIEYAQLRYELANSIAPVGQTDYNGNLLTPGTPVALLSIPAIHLTTVVSEGTTGAILQNGPGHRRDSAMPGQPGASVIYARRLGFGGPFASLPSLKSGDAIYVTTGQGVATYTVADVRYAGDKEPSVQINHGLLSLVTAGGSRFLPNGVVAVDANLTTTPFQAPGAVIGSSALSRSEGPMQGDPGAWVGLVLWGELLVGATVAMVWARKRWGIWQAWIVGIPVVVLLGILVANQVTTLLPNML
jgi:sortase A